MKILVIGLEGVVPQMLFGDKRMVNIRHLMAFGCYGQLVNTPPLNADLGWYAMAASQETNSLRDYHAMPEKTLWGYLASQGKRVILVGVPPYDSPVAMQGAESTNQQIANQQTTTIQKLDIEYPTRIKQAKIAQART